MQLNVFRFYKSIWIFFSFFSWSLFFYLPLDLILKELLVLQKNCGVAEMEEKEADVNKLNMQEKEYSWLVKLWQQRVVHDLVFVLSQLEY